MAADVYVEAEILALTLAYLQGAYPGKPIGPKSFLGQLARSLAQLVGAIQQAIKAADDDGVPAYDTASAVIRSRCSAQALDNWAVTFGLPSNKSVGAFGRNGPVVATGGGGNVTGAAGATFLTGALLVDGSGQTQVELVAGVIIPGGGTIPGQFQAVAAGVAGNLAAGTRLQWLSPPAGASPFVTLTTALSGGYDVESDLHLLERLILRLREPPKGGTAHDYRTWAEESTDSTGRSLGIARAYVYPHRDGLGSEDIIITIAGSGLGRGDISVSGMAARRTACQAYIDAIRPVNDGPRVLLPYFDAARGLTIVLQVVPTVAYPWDWTATGSAPLWAGSTTTRLRILTGAIPAALAQAISDGRMPRIQILLPESPLPQVVQITSSAVLGAGVTEWTITPALTSSPNVNTEIWPAGGHVLPVATSVLSYIDSIGPSQQSGFHNTVTDSWEALVTIGKIAWAALGATDDIGERVLVYSPQVGMGVGVKVAVGAGALGSTDTQLFDNWPANGPELPWTTAIRVLPLQ